MDPTERRARNLRALGGYNTLFGGLMMLGSFSLAVSAFTGNLPRHQVFGRLLMGLLFLILTSWQYRKGLRQRREAEALFRDLTPRT